LSLKEDLATMLKNSTPNTGTLVVYLDHLKGLTGLDSEEACSPFVEVVFPNGNIDKTKIFKDNFNPEIKQKVAMKYTVPANNLKPLVLKVWHEDNKTPANFLGETHIDIQGCYKAPKQYFIS
jgi:Ca2+-dependent lipid-binding protein